MVNRPERPGGLEFRAHTFDSPNNASMSSLSLQDLPSPRAGEVPPALSPLDALALQGRLLARRFEQEEKAGRRMSRLAPLTIQNEFGNRSGYFSSLSNSTINSPIDELPPPISPAQAQSSPVEQASADKHRSFYPQIGGNENYELSVPPRHHARGLPSIGETDVTSNPRGYFDLPRSQSPEPDEPRIGLTEATPRSPNMPQPSPASLQRSLNRQQSLDVMPSKQRSQQGLRPPRSPGSQRSRSPGVSPSIRSVPGDSAEDVDNMSLSGSYDSLNNRNLSPSSSLSRAHSPYTPYTNPSFPRSPSQSSERSVSRQASRQPFNFSRPNRPTSSSSRPSVDRRPSDGPTRQFSDESTYMRPSVENTRPRRQDSIESSGPNFGNDMIHTPVSMTSEDWRRSTDYSNPAPTYTYSKFSLPRGRKLDRRSIGVEDFLNSQINWDHPKQTTGSQRPPSPDSPARSFEQQRPSYEQVAARNASMDHGAPSLTSSNSTVRAPTTGSDQITSQQHCDKGIELHEAGEFMKSTYHFRLAARSGLPEAMFWYGLACRHGWGMRENKTEAFTWLRRAVDSGHLEIAEDEDQSKHGQTTDFTKKKQHRAQYAVAIYELGKCYMNGWGAHRDKTLALRCYEIAGNWGDADALQEAGYCYAEGVGCKKDMKKAAKFYKAAEAKGVSMVGNSWYVGALKSAVSIANLASGSTRKSTTRTKTLHRISGLFAPVVRPKKTLQLKRNLAIRAEHGSCSAAKSRLPDHPLLPNSLLMRPRFDFPYIFWRLD